MAVEASCDICLDCDTSIGSPQATDFLSLRNLFPVGAIALQVVGVPLLCPHDRAEDGWHVFNVSSLLTQSFNHEDASVIHEVKFLVSNQFVAATWRSYDDTRLVLRIYLIPYDLAGMSGRLKCRKKPIVSHSARSLALVLPRLKCELWNGHFPALSYPSQVFPTEKDNRTLSEVYGDIPSPEVASRSNQERVIARLLDLNDTLADIGLWTTLYSYQRQSIATMLSRETSTQAVPDPLYLRLTALNGQTFYFQPATTELLKEQPTVVPPSSGVLCEELGTGKTVMILGLILATRQTLSVPEESIMEAHPILTPVSLTTFPCHTQERQRLNRGKSAQNEPPTIPTLGDILLHLISTNPQAAVSNPLASTKLALGRQQRLLDKIQPHLRDRFQTNAPFYYRQAGGKPSDYERAQRANVKNRPHAMFITGATLIVVPVNLISQWDREINKHCAYPLRVLMVRTRNELPSARTLASDYDIVLMTIPRFTAENDLNKKPRSGGQPKACRCAPFLESELINCTCHEAVVSPLLRVRWRRMVLDEGHISASINSSLLHFAKMLSVEHRWIVTGTPTTNLLGLQFGTSSNEVGMDDQVDEITVNESEQGVRVWTNDDREDLRKLGSMIANFLGLQQFSSNPKLFNTHVTDALLNSTGPLPGAIDVLTQLMSFVMVRHRVEHVERDIVLPPITQESVFLDLDPLAIKSYNAFQASIVINAVDSERTDQDYLFHPKNVDSLQKTVDNMSQIMFWAVDDHLYNADEIVRGSDELIETAKGRATSKDDQDLLEEAITHLRSAASDSLWRSIHAYTSYVPYRVTNMSETTFNAWTRTPHPESKTASRLVHGDRLIAFRDTIIRQPLISETRLLELAGAISEKDEVHQRLLDELMRKKDAKKEKVSRMFPSVRKAVSPEMMQEMKNELDAVLKRLEYLETHDEGSASDAPADVTLRSEIAGGNLVSISPHRSIRVGCSPSSKLNYIINEVLQYASSEKFLIFSSSVLTLAWIGEALELLDIKYLRFTTIVPAKVREQTVLTFETSEKYRIFLMELKHGARGLNLVSASRVIFCEPVWEADVESQAIKRVHRIGQSRPVTVKTLVIRGTAEENMIHRRKMLQSSSQTKLPRLLHESGMRHYIANPQFIRDPPNALTNVGFPLFNISQATPERETDTISVDEAPRASADRWSTVRVEEPSASTSPLTIRLKRVRVEDPIAASMELSSSPSPPKKKSAVRFADN